MASYFYINSSGQQIEFASIINLCETRGMMSFCKAASIADQAGCKYHDPCSDKNSNHCCHWRETMNGACDNMYAQRNIEIPK
jgi:hypothetical protein